MAADGEIVRATFNYSQPNASAQQNVFHWEITGGSPTDQEVVNTINNWALNDWGPHWEDIADGISRLDDFVAQIVNVDGTIVRNIGGFLIGVGGGLSGGVVEAAVSAYLLARTLFPKTRGSKYIPGMAETATGNGAISAPVMVELSFMLANWIDDITIGTGGELAAGVPSASNGVFVPFLNNGDITDIPAYQRRRKPNVGE